MHRRKKVPVLFYGPRGQQHKRTHYCIYTTRQCTKMIYSFAIQSSIESDCVGSSSLYITASCNKCEAPRIVMGRRWVYWENIDLVLATHDVSSRCAHIWHSAFVLPFPGPIMRLMTVTSVVLDTVFPASSRQLQLGAFCRKSETGCHSGTVTIAANLRRRCRDATKRSFQTLFYLIVDNFP